MGFVIYDLVLLGLFVLFVIIFLASKKNQKNLTRQGIMYLYRTRFGIKFIDGFAKRYEKILKPARYLVLTSGYLLLIAICWIVVQTTWIYLTTSISKVIKAPPIAPLIPYFPKLFGLESFFPPLYFTYFIIAIAIVAISHEFSHGIFARVEKLEIKSTGFAFLGPILGAFVEPDEKKMNKAPKFSQLSILAAGTFANVIMTILFGVIMAIFFTSLFVPAGLKFNTYVYSNVNVGDITVVGNSMFNENFLEININGKVFFAEKNAYQNAQENEIKNIIVFDDTPAFRNQIDGAIIEINGQKITSREKLSEILGSLSPGDEINIKTASTAPGTDTIDKINEYNFELAEKDGKSYLGIAFLTPAKQGLISRTINGIITKIKQPMVLYESTIGDFGWFIYYLLWWLVMINLLVALFNMLPLGILDGGRFFYLTVWGITGSEKIGKKAYSFATYFLLFLLLVLMVKWLFSFAA